MQQFFHWIGQPARQSIHADQQAPRVIP